VRGRSRAARLRRLLVCLGLGALAPLGSVRLGSVAAGAVVGLVVAAALELVGDLLDDE
jgi:hypothetical protein